MLMLDVLEKRIMYIWLYITSCPFAIKVDRTLLSTYYDPYTHLSLLLLSSKFLLDVS
jgi:hypothetical protein